MERTDELKERIRQQPLNDRLEESRRRIGDMCSKGRCPKMTIPVQHDDDDFYINTTLADAQATIAALQARVQELEQWVQDQSTANLEKMRHMDEMQSRAMEAESQLTQRTAELARVRGELAETKEVEAALSSKVAEYEVELNGDPQNFYGRGRTVGLRTLIAALPKVEGEIEVCSGVYNFILLKHDSGNRFLCGQIETEQTAKAIAALWQHRQGMEG